MRKVFQKYIDGKSAKSNCVYWDSTKIPKFRIQFNFLFQGKEVWNSKEVISLTKWTVVFKIKHYSGSDSLSQ